MSYLERDIEHSKMHEFGFEFMRECYVHFFQIKCGLVYKVEINI